MLFFLLSCKLNLKENLGTHLRDNHAYTVLGDFELFWTLVKQRPKRSHFFPISYNSNLKVDLDTHLRGTHKNVQDGVSL